MFAVEQVTLVVTRECVAGVAAASGSPSSAGGVPAGCPLSWAHCCLASLAAFANKQVSVGNRRCLVVEPRQGISVVVSR